ncbi:unnamed protein product, partial [Aureobasidium vineae]
KIINMSASWSKGSKDSITAESIAIHLNSEPNLPGAEDLDVDLVIKWLLALNLSLRTKEIKRLAPKVLEELRAMDGIAVEEAVRHQQCYPIKRDVPILVYTWSGNGEAQEVKRETSSPKQQRSASEVVSRKKPKKHGIDADKQAPLNTEDNDEAGGVKLEDTSAKEDANQTAAEAAGTAATKKKAMRAARRARKLAKALEEAKPPVGKKEEDNDSDSGNESDWTQTSWSPSWATGSEEED